MDNNCDDKCLDDIGVLWAKYSDDDDSWLPLVTHISDSAGVSRILWERWVSEPVKSIIYEGVLGIDNKPVCIDVAKRVIEFAAASHDLGKATPAFQFKIRNMSAGSKIIDRIQCRGLKVNSHLEDQDAIPHGRASELILERNSISRTFAIISGGHHGVPPTEMELSKMVVNAYRNNTGFEDPIWVELQNKLLEYCAKISCLSLKDLTSIHLSIEAQVEITALVIMADWIASNKDYFPYIKIDDNVADTSESRVAYSWKILDLPEYVGSGKSFVERSFEGTFGFSPRPFQVAAYESVINMGGPGILFFEAPMGEGKTEAALYAAEILANRFGQKGIFFALPTQTTSDSMFQRVEKWIENATDGSRRTVFLAHGKSRFNKFYSQMPRNGWNIDNNVDGDVIVHQWFSGKKGMLSDFVIGTVDQILLAGLKSKHLALRHLGLSEKVVIIDECHAYDEYMGSYLEKTVRWLGVYKIPVIIISATLPKSRKMVLLKSYLGVKNVVSSNIDSTSYPLITYADVTKISQLAPQKTVGRKSVVNLNRIKDNDVIRLLKDYSADGGYVGLIVNTIARSQNLASVISESFPGDEVILLHSCFTSIDRSYRESKVVEMLGKERRKPAPYRAFIIGTQVMEQSLDLDFDILFSDICPVDLLIQRIGRLHRHENIRPEKMKKPICFIIDTGTNEFEKGSESIYGKYQLMNSRLLLSDSITIPDDIPHIVHSAYDGPGPCVPGDIEKEYVEARSKMELGKKAKENKAKIYQISSPQSLDDLAGWIIHPSDGSDAKMEASVRDIRETIEVILISKSIDGSFKVLEWVPEFGAKVIPSEVVPGDDIAFAIAGCKVRLPYVVFGHIGVDNTIERISAMNRSEIPRVWKSSQWLSDELFLILDEHNSVSFNGFTIRYTKEKGVELNG